MRFSDGSSCNKTMVKARVVKATPRFASWWAGQENSHVMTNSTCCGTSKEDMVSWQARSAGGKPWSD